MAFLAGIGWRLQRKFRVTSSQTHSNSVSDTPITCQSPCRVTHECSIPTAKTGKRPHPDLVTHASPRLSHEGSEPRPFSVLGRWGDSRTCVRGAFTVVLTRPRVVLQPALQLGFFWLAFREAHPQMVFNASRPCEKLAMSWCSYGSFDGSHSSPLLPVGVQTIRHMQRISPASSAASPR